MTELTPLMKQYFSIKEQYSDAIVFFRLGDFYEMFGDDAEIASKILQITLTTRDKGKDNPVPMCGVPYFASESYISKLIKAGYKVAICEQIEDPKDAKGIVAREVTRVITPGTHIPDNPRENNFILSIFPSGKKHGLTAADISTGEFILLETCEKIDDEISRFEPREIIIPSSLMNDLHYTEILSGFFVSAVEDLNFDISEAYKTLLRHFRVSSLEGFGCEGMTAAISAAGALISYLEQTQKNFLSFKKISIMRESSFMLLDTATQRNLELLHNLKDNSREGTLIGIMDETVTAMGSRFLRSAITRPLIDIAKIRSRYNCIDYLIEDFELLEELRSHLRKVQDIERISSKISSGTANARDLIALKISIVGLPGIKKALSFSKEPYLKQLSDSINVLSHIREIIEKAIDDNPPAVIKEGGIIKEGFNAEIDSLRNLSVTGKDFIAELEAREKKRTGISSLKVGFNKIFGYYIEITKSNLDMVPDNYIRKQTLVGGERFITPELKEYENRVLGAEERLKNLEYQIFLEILDSIKKDTDNLIKTSEILAELDFLISLAVIARRYNYVRPVLTDEPVIEIVDGRHPVLERIMLDERFIPNSTSINPDNGLMMIITGPNMAGKSTYMRQVALITLMAQIGSFVPAASATIGITDRIFTRIGASDYLSKGQSTFMVEMIETANIINNASNKSLIILDEVGRGTSTFDGISLAWAIAEHILSIIKARTLFATHYNELTELALIHEGVGNYNISVREWGDEIIFMRKIEKGPADKSYGLQVARLAGIPDIIIRRAREVLTNLEKEELNEAGEPRFAIKKTKKKSVQLDLFSSINDSVIKEIINMKIENINPEEAYQKLAEFKRLLTS